jgi:hypothetical protein
MPSRSAALTAAASELAAPADAPEAINASLASVDISSSVNWVSVIAFFRINF